MAMTEPRLLTMADYWLGRDRQCADQFTITVQTSGRKTVRRWNLLIGEAAKDGVFLMSHPVNGTPVADGWRPAGSATSKHYSAEACDGQDHADRRFAVWVCKNLHVSERIGLWWEDFRWTRGKYTNWCHGQTRAASKRIYLPYPDVAAHPATDPDFYVTHGLAVP